MPPLDQLASPSPPPAGLPKLSAARLAGSVAVWLLLLSATLYHTELYNLVDTWWGQVGLLPGSAQQSPGMLASGSIAAPFMHRAHSLPAVAVYSGLYLGLCLSLLFLLVPGRASRRLGLLFYGGAGLALGLLMLLSRTGEQPALAVLTSQLLHFIMSPLPVMVLVPLLRWADK